MMDKDVQSVTQETICGAAMPDRIWLVDMGSGDVSWTAEREPDGEEPLEAVEYVRLASQPTNAEDAVAWEWRVIGTKDWIMQRAYPNRSGERTDIERRPLYARPTPDTQTAAIGAEAVEQALALLDRAGKHIADSDVWASIHEEAVALRDNLSQPVAAPQQPQSKGTDDGK